MKKSVTNIISTINRRKLSSNTQKIALALLKAEGTWLSRNQLERIVPSATARVRDLRQERFGEFEVECEAAPLLNKRGSSKDFYYRINPTTVSVDQVKSVFRV